MLLLTFSHTASAHLPEDFSLLHGKPDSKIETWSEYTELTKFPQDASVDMENELKIVRFSDNNISWLTRESEELLHRRAGIYDIFLSAGHAGYIKVVYDPPKCRYMEHAHRDFGSVTHYGSCELINT